MTIKPKDLPAASAYQRSIEQIETFRRQCAAHYFRISIGDQPQTTLNFLHGNSHEAPERGPLAAPVQEAWENIRCAIDDELRHQALRNKQLLAELGVDVSEIEIAPREIAPRLSSKFIEWGDILLKAQPQQGLDTRILSINFYED